MIYEKGKSVKEFNLSKDGKYTIENLPMGVYELIENPYTTIVNLLIEGPKNENHEKTIPDGTTLLNVTLEGDVLKLDFSQEFVNNHIGGKEEEQNTINSLVNTLTELTEVNSIKILINGEENKSFNDGKLDFTNNFTRNE